MEGRERIAPHRKRLPFGAVEIGLGIDSRYALSQEEHRTIAQEAAALGYQSLWTPIGSTREPFDLCVLWHESSGLGTGIAVAPISGWAIDHLAELAKATHRRCAGRFTFGVGSGRVTDAPIRAMRDAIGALRSRLPGVRIYLGALGPQMLHLAGESADGAALNWCSAEQVTWSRERVAEGARRSGREPRSVALHEYIRVCVDEDESAARTAFAKKATWSPRLRAVLDELESRRAAGANEEELAARCPDSFLRRVGYWGAPKGARQAFAKLAAGLDIAVVRLVPARRNDLAAARLAMTACAPGS